MKKIVLLLLFIAPLASYSQKKVVFDTTIANTSSREFFQRNVDVDSVLFNNYFGQSNMLRLYLKGLWYDSSYVKENPRKSEYYNNNFLGDKYRFERKYGGLRLPDQDMAIVRKRSCGHSASLSFVATSDSIKFTLESYCPTEHVEDDYERVFTKTERLANYKGGIAVLQHAIGSAYKRAKFLKDKERIDSALIFKVLVDRKDSCLKEIELIEGRYSHFAQFIMEVLKDACSWKAAEQGGRSVISYLEIFFRLNKDNSITVGI